MALKKDPNPLEKALQTFREGNLYEAERILSYFVAAKFNLDLETLTIRQDRLSLNSISGTLKTRDGRKLFFKFHTEESEETVAEYYRAELLARAGYPVEHPVYVSKDVGEQILIYPYKESERLADMCRRLDKSESEKSEEFRKLVKAQQNLDRICAEKCLETLKTGTPNELAREPLLQLFYWRLVDRQPDGTLKPGGRHHSFYVGKKFTLPGGMELSYDELAKLRWSINGYDYPITFARAFEHARRILAPGYFAEYAACTAHGDAHNGNVWVNSNEAGEIALSWFDPAFAGDYIPALLAEVKPLFHNIFAHPSWLYDSREADPDINVSCAARHGKIIVEHDWQLTPLRKSFLDSKLENFWKPVLKELKAKDQLANEWEDYVRAALFCCPTLVMNLRANTGSRQNSHTPKTSLLGLSISIMLASAPENGIDVVSAFFKTLRKSIS